MKIVSRIALLMCLATVVPATAKPTIGPVSLQIEVATAGEALKQINQFKTIEEYKNSVCEKLGSDFCNAIINQIAECTKGALSNIRTDNILENGFDRDQVIKAAQGCANDLWISDCLSSSLGALDDIKNKMNFLGGQPGRMEQIVERQLINPLTGETIQAKIDMADRTQNSLSETYDLLTGNGANTQLGASTLAALQAATSETSNMQMVVACSQDALAATKWVPAASVPSPMDLAPSVPKSIQSILTSTQEGSQDLLSKAGAAVTSATDYVSGTDSYRLAAAGYSAAYDGASLYLDGTDAFARLEQNAVNGSVSGTFNSLDALANVGGKAYDRYGGTTYVDPYLDKAGDAIRPYVDSGKEMIQNSAVGQAVSSVGNGAMSAVGTGAGMLQSGFDTAYSGVTGVGGAISDTVNGATTSTAKFMDDKMVALQDEITGLMKAGIDTSIELARKNQNDMQVNSNSSGIGGGKRASDLVASNAAGDLKNLSDGADSAEDIMSLLKQISLVRVQALQKHTAITSLKAQIAEQDAMDVEIAGGVLSQKNSSETEG